MRINFATARLLVLAACVACASAAVRSASAGTAAPSPTPGATLYVAPTGDDKAAGTAAAPFATLDAARDAIRRMKAAGPLPAGGVVVEVRPGTYERMAPLDLTAADSGTAEAPIVYRAATASAAAAAGQQVRLVGGKVVQGFQPVTDAAVLARLDPAARGKVLQADLKALGVTDFGQLRRRGFGQPQHVAHMELFFADRPMTLARWPNEGYSQATSIPEGKDGRVLGYDGDRPARWAAEPDAWLYGYWMHDWADTYIEVEKIDPAAHTIALKIPPPYFGIRKGARWCAINCLCELDSPGEYYVDRAKGMLYFWPPAGEGDWLRNGAPSAGSVPVPAGSAKAMVSVAEQLVKMKDVAYVTVRGFVLECCRGTAVTIDGGHHNQIVGCTIRNIGNKAAGIKGSDNAIIGCDIYETGDGGIWMWGGDRRTLTPGRQLAENNHIHDYSRWCHTYRPAVGVDGCGNIVRNNLLHDGPHNAIQLGGNDHVVELNEIHSVCYDTGDVGAFYMGRDWSSRGTIIRNNYFHHIFGPGQLGAMGVYLDDQASGIQTVGNVFWHVTRAMFIGGGCDNVTENNVFVDCTPAMHLDDRGMNWQKKATDDPKGELRHNLAAMPYQDELWTKRYPNLPNILNDDPGVPKRNLIARNISVGGKWDDVEKKIRQFQTVQDNLVDQDPHFVDAAKGDFRLKEDSPAWKLGFKAIPIEKIGLYQDDRRASWPVVHAPRKMPPAAAATESGAATGQPAGGPAPVYAVPRSTAAFVIDGTLDPAELVGPGVLLAEDFAGAKATPTSRAWLRHDGANLYIAFDNTVLAQPALKRAAEWGGNDACEIALRNPADGKDAPILVFRGFVDEAGTFVVSDESDAPAAAIAKARQGVEYKAKVISPTRWTAEWKIPWSSLAIDPAKAPKLQANLAVRKMAEDLWLQWRSTRGNTFDVPKAGVLEVGK